MPCDWCLCCRRRCSSTRGDLRLFAIEHVGVVLCRWAWACDKCERLWWVVAPPLGRTCPGCQLPNVVFSLNPQTTSPSPSSPLKSIHHGSKGSLKLLEPNTFKISQFNLRIQSPSSDSSNNGTTSVQKQQQTTSKSPQSANPNFTAIQSRQPRPQCRRATTHCSNWSKPNAQRLHRRDATR